MKVLLSRRAQKALDESPPAVKGRLKEKIAELFQTAYPAGSRKLRGTRNAYRLRVGDYRILYVILPKEEILVFKIAPREAVYE